MQLSDATTLVEYFIWADNEILNACERIAPDAWTRPATPDPGWHTLKGTLVHTLDVEYGWRVRLQDLPDTIISEDDFVDLASLRARYDEEHTARRRFVAGLSEAELNAVWHEDGQAQIQRWHTIVHVYTEGMQHRSEAAAMLTGFGASPGEIDFQGWLIWRAGAEG